MTWNARLRFLMAFGVALTTIAVPVFLDVMRILLICVVTARSASERRRRCSARITLWAYHLFALIERILDLNVEWHLPPPVPDRELIVIANHRSSIDPVILLACLHRLGLRNTNWIAKGQMLLVPPVALMGLSIGTMFITRYMPGTDGLIIERGTKRVLEDHAKVCIFPEGTRFAPDKRRDGFQHVLAPRRRGFGILRRALPEASVLSVLFHWEEGATGNGQARTIWNMASLHGKRLVVRVTLTEPVTLDADRDWLVSEFRRWDQELSSPI